MLRSVAGRRFRQRGSSPRTTTSCASAEPCGAPSACCRGDPHGLVASLVHVAVLARRGVTASLVIGVRPDKELGAHAWVEVGWMPALPAAKDKFAQLITL
jgi:Transglutaminase-like superfamily